MCDILVIVAPGVSTRSCVRRRPAQLADTMQSVNDIVSGVFVDVEGARGPLSQRWQTSGRFNARSLAGREASAMGCHSRFHPSGLLSQCHSSPGGCSCRVGINRKSGKCAHLPGSYDFKPTAIESLGSLSELELNLFLHMGRRISSATDDDREGQFLCQRLSVTVQRFNAILLHQIFVESGQSDL